MAHYPNKFSAKTKVVLPSYSHLKKAQRKIARRSPAYNFPIGYPHADPSRLFAARMTFRIRDAYGQRVNAYWGEVDAFWRDVLWDQDYDYANDDYCDTCGNTGFLNCYCGGDLCVCNNGGEIDCPDCGY